MRGLKAVDIRDMNLLKHYRIIRKWACKNNEINDADLELLIYLDCLDFFTRHDFEIGSYSYSWDKKRWDKLYAKGWITTWRKRNNTSQKYNIYKVSFKCKQLISRMYRIMLGEEDLPTSHRNIISKKKSYSDRVLMKSIENVNKDKTR
jgi:hypothetical protein